MKQEQLKQIYNYLNHEHNALNDHELVFGHVKTFITTLNIYMKWIQKKKQKKNKPTHYEKNNPKTKQVKPKKQEQKSNIFLNDYNYYQLQY